MKANTHCHVYPFVLGLRASVIIIGRRGEENRRRTGLWMDENDDHDEVHVQEDEHVWRR